MIKKTSAWLQQVVLTQISYSFHEADLNPVVVTKKDPVLLIVVIFLTKWSLHVLTSGGNEMAEK